MSFRSKMTTILVLFALAVSGCASVDQTEHCVRTRYGKVKVERMDPGLTFTGMVDDVTCFNMTEQAWPEDGGVETMAAQTSDPLTIQGDVAILWRFNPETVFETFLDKRSQAAVEVDILNAVREGYRNALSGWSVDDIFSERRAGLSDSVQKHIQESIGDRAEVMTVFVRNVSVPQEIEAARQRTIERQQELQAARQQYQIDSVQSAAGLIQAQMEAMRRELEAEAYMVNPDLLELRAAEALAAGLKDVCRGVQTCIIGASALDKFLSGR